MGIDVVNSGEKAPIFLVMQPEALANTIENAYYSIELQVLLYIHERWLKILNLIVNCKGKKQPTGRKV